MGEGKENDQNISYEKNYIKNDGDETRSLCPCHWRVPIADSEHGLVICFVQQQTNTSISLYSAVSPLRCTPTSEAINTSRPPLEEAITHLLESERSPATKMKFPDSNSHIQGHPRLSTFQLTNALTTEA